MNIAIIGTGYVGLVTGAGLANFGNDVICVDINDNKIDALRRGEIPIFEPGLDNLVEKNVSEGRLKFTTDLADAIRKSYVIFIAVGTPQGQDGGADLKYVKEVAGSIAKYMEGPKVVVTKSTVPTGTGKIIEEILERTPHKHPAVVVSNPEFLREGSAIEDFLNPDRVVIGSDDEGAIATMKEVYAPLHSLSIPFVVTSIESAELIKYASNGFLATKISFINEIAALCEELGADVQDVARGMGLDSRIGPKFLQAGPGFGGSCFPKDTAALAEIARGAGHPFRIIDAVIAVNDAVKRRMVDIVERALGGVEGKTIGVLGLAFKPETDDMRESPSIPLIEGLRRMGARVRAYDPEAMEPAREVFDSIDFCRDAYETAEGCDALVIVTEWNEFRALNLDRIRDALKRPLIIDLRNIYDPRRMRDRGFEYVCVGRGVTEPAPAGVE